MGKYGIFFQLRLMTCVGINPHGYSLTDFMGLLMCLRQPGTACYLKAGCAVRNGLREALSQTALRPSPHAPHPHHTRRSAVRACHLAHQALKASAESFARAVSLLRRQWAHGSHLRPHPDPHPHRSLSAGGRRLREAGILARNRVSYLGITPCMKNTC